MDTRGWRDFLFGSDAVVGYDLFITQPRQREQVPCRVCGALCNAHRNVYDETDAGLDLGPRLMLHDRFECPHRQAAWHRSARALVQRIESAAGAQQREALYAELETLLRLRDIPAAC